MMKPAPARRAPAPEIVLRDVSKTDLRAFFRYQLDPVARHMAAFTSKDPADRDAFMERWSRILRSAGIRTKTILFKGRVVGSVLTFTQEGKREVSYWIDRRYWNRGIATAALARMVSRLRARPVYARVASDNAASIRVLEKCGFRVCGQARGFANARGAEIDELVLRLPARRRRATPST